MWLYIVLLINHRIYLSVLKSSMFIYSQLLLDCLFVFELRELKKLCLQYSAHLECLAYSGCLMHDDDHYTQNFASVQNRKMFLAFIYYRSFISGSGKTEDLHYF